MVVWVSVTEHYGGLECLSGRLGERHRALRGVGVS